MSRTTKKILAVSLILVLLVSGLALPATAAPPAPVTFTILHTNDFHGQLEASNADPNKISTPGMARTAHVIQKIRDANTLLGQETLLVDAGDEMQGSLLSNLGDGTPTGKGKPTIDTFIAMNYAVATFGNHEFDWGQVNLTNRTTEAAATYPYVTANIVKNDTGNCATAGWTKPDFAAEPYVIKTVAMGGNTVKVAFIGVTTTETPTITVATATAGLCFKDPQASIEHYYAEIKAQADVIVILSHLGNADGGYGYGIPVIGDQTLAANLIKAGKPVDLIIGGHSHTSVAAPGQVIAVTGYTAKTTVVQAAYNGRRVGQADITVGTDGSVSINWKVTVWTQQNTSATPPIPASVWRTYTTASAYTEDTDVSKDPTIDALITGLANDPDYLALVNTPIGYSAVDLPRSNTGDNMMGTFIDDAIYKYLNTDAKPENDVDLFFNNAGGIRTDWCYVSGVWSNTGCVAGIHDPALLTYGNMFTVLPFGNATVVGDMTGAQILDVVNYGPNVAGVIQPAGLKYKYYSYKDANPGPQPYAWGAFDVCVVNKTTKACDPLDLKKTYKVGTNEFLAPAGGDGYNGFKYMTNITYWGDMLNAVNAYVANNYGTAATAYKGPNGDGTLDGRIVRDGTDAGGSIVPITILHHNDSHGNLAKGTYAGYTQLATLIKQERAHNPTRTLLFTLGDNIQGDSMMYYFKNAPQGKTADGTLLPPSLWQNPLVAAMNAMSYNGMLLGNHEFNFGSEVFTSTFSQAAFPILGANVADSGAYGINKVGLDAAASAQGVKVNVHDGLEFVLPSGDPAKPVKVGILGITNHRVPNYELPSNIPGLTFSNPIDTAQDLVPDLKGRNDAVVALTHIGFTENPASVEVDANVDTNLAATVPNIDAILGSHSHTDPSKQTASSGAYKYLPAIVAGPNNVPVLINQAYRYNNTLGEVVIGMRAKAGSGYEVVSRSGRYLSVSMSTSSPTLEDAAIKAIVDPYAALLTSYNNTVIGKTEVPIDTTNAYVAETNAANLQADAAIHELAAHGITDVDFHLSGAMTRPSDQANWVMFKTATPATPVDMKVSDMFTLMPYENSLVTMRMNGPQLKAVLERAYRNYYYYKYVPGQGGYSWYTTCMIDTNKNNVITYADMHPALPNGSNVISLVINGVPVNFNDAAKYYKVSTVNYLAAGSCNFNDGGVSLWPLNQIVDDTQYYVRDAVIDYVKAQTGPIAPAIEGRLQFGTWLKTFMPIVGKN